MLGKPFIQRFEEASSGPAFHSAFATSVPLVQGPPAMPSPSFGQSSMVDKMVDAPRPPVEAGEAVAAITKTLSSMVTPQDDDAKAMLFEWCEFSEKLTRFLTARKETRTAFLRSEDARLTREGRAVLDKIRQLTLKSNGLVSQWNQMEASASDLRSVLNGLLTNSPGRLDDDESFVLSEEIESWQHRVTQAQAQIDAQNAAMAPVSAEINRLGEEIRAETQKLKAIKHARLQVRDELLGFDVRGPADTGLRGRVGHARLG